MSTAFENRVFGCVIVKAINANYNADFSHQPRRLPDGTVYATDKVLKYSIRNYFSKRYTEDKIFYFKSLSEEMQPRSLDETYENFFGDLKKVEGKNKSLEMRKTALSNLLTCIDVRLFGGTFPYEKANLSLHGPVQITHGVNRYKEGIIYSEQISSPFRNSNDKSENSLQTTLGTQFKLREGHYVHHFSVNPGNLKEFAKLVDAPGILTEDIEKLKQGLMHGATFYDSAAKAGVENELLLWVELNPKSMLVLPSFVELISVDVDPADPAKRVIDLSKVTAALSKPHVQEAIAKIEIFHDAAITTLAGAPANAVIAELN